MQPGRIVVVGSANADLVLQVDHRPAGGETVLGSDLVVSAGGKGANQAVAAARLGGHVQFVGCVGDDDHGALLRGSLGGAGVDLAGLGTATAATGTAVIVLTPDAENSIIVSPGANALVTADVVDRSVDWAATAVLVVQLEVPLPTVALVAQRAREHGVRLILNAAPAAALDPTTLAGADPLVVNQSEAASLLAGAVTDGDPTATARALLDLGPRSVVLTLGADGSVWCARDGDAVRAGRRSALRVAPVDTTGAGDCYVGALAVVLAEGGDLADAVARATQVAAVAVTRPGAQASFPTREEMTATTETTGREGTCGEKVYGLA
ncbi:MAG TPA: ribokinase [Cellulomonas sp.]